MNKKLLIGVIIILILGGGLYFFSNSPKVENQTPAPEATEQNPQTITIELSLKTQSEATESSAITINLPSGSEHCEVLNQALADGKIKDLDMRFNEEYKTNSVFVINGLGKTDSPWWVYKINGADAPAGCSQVKVNQGDKILWEYLGT